MGQNNAHLKLRITKGFARFDVVAFGKGNLALEFSQAKGLGKLLPCLLINGMVILVFSSCWLMLGSMVFNFIIFVESNASYSCRCSYFGH